MKLLPVLSLAALGLAPRLQAATITDVISNVSVCDPVVSSTTCRSSQNSGATQSTTTFATRFSDSTGTVDGSGTAFSDRGTTRLQTNVIVNRQVGTRLASSAHADVFIQDILNQPFDWGFDLPFASITGGFDASGVGVVSSGTEVKYFPEGKLVIGYRLTARNGSGQVTQFLADGQTFTYSSPGTAINETAAFSIRGLKGGTDYEFFITIGFDGGVLYQAVGGSGGAIGDAHYSVTGDLSHTILLGAATVYDANGVALPNSLVGASGYDYTVGANSGGGGSTAVPEPGTVALTFGGLALVVYSRRRTGHHLAERY